MVLLRKNLFQLIITLLIIILPAAGLSAGKININPMISGSLRMDNNFYRAENIEREVYTYLLQPGIEIDYEEAKTFVSLEYTLDAYTYSDRDVLRSNWQSVDTEDFIGHTAELKAGTKLLDRLTLGLEESYLKSRDPDNSDKFNNSVDREKFSIHRAIPLIGYDIDT